MGQLIMRWKNDNSNKSLVLPNNIKVKTLTEIENGISVWLDIIKYMSQPVVGRTMDYYDKTMVSRENFDENMCYFLIVDGIPAATITVICDHVKKEGYIHMVACKPEFRGRGLGNILNDVAVCVLKSQKMETAYLTTDEWRIPAIKTYLKSGFLPDLKSEPDFKERWDKVYAVINKS